MTPHTHHYSTRSKTSTITETSCIDGESDPGDWVWVTSKKPVWTMAVLQLKWVSDFIYTAHQIILSYFFQLGLLMCGCA